MILNPKHASRFGVLDGLEKLWICFSATPDELSRGGAILKTLENLNESKDFSFFLFLGFFKGTFL